MSTTDPVIDAAPQVKAAPVAAPPDEDGRPRSFDVGTCEVCGHNTVDGHCGHCGHPLPGRDE